MATYNPKKQSLDEVIASYKARAAEWAREDSYNQEKSYCITMTDGKVTTRFNPQLYTSDEARDFIRLHNGVFIDEEDGKEYKLNIEPAKENKLDFER